MKQFGVIDLGTNTFHLLIVEQEQTGTFKTLYRERIFVKLAEDGIKTIGEKPFQRGIDVIVHFNSKVDEYQLSGFKVFGTAALRTASNGALFTKEIKRLTDIDIELISGDQEANLIYKGVKQAVPLTNDYSLIMDIGGGSVEFIIANIGGAEWAQSFPIGVAVLFNKFHHNDPIAAKEINDAYQFLEKNLQPLIQILKQYNVRNLIGASGTFDVLENVLPIQKTNPIHSVIPVDLFPSFYDYLIPSKLQERLEYQKIPDSRAELVIVATILIDFILKISQVQQIDVSAYAMKEGMLSEMMNAQPNF